MDFFFCFYKYVKQTLVCNMNHCDMIAPLLVSPSIDTSHVQKVQVKSVEDEVKNGCSWKGTPSEDFHNRIRANINLNN